MAYNTNDFTQVTSGVYKYYTTDSLATITASGYFSDLVSAKSGEVGDLITVSDGVADNAVETPNRVVLQVASVSGNAGTAGVAGNITPTFAATATSDGTGTGTLTDPGTDFAVNVTSSSANNIIVLPVPVAGRRIKLIVGANGYELRSSTPASIAIGGGTGASAESAIPANSVAVLEAISATAWVGYTIAGATLAAVEAAV